MLTSPRITNIHLQQESRVLDRYEDHDNSIFAFEQQKELSPWHFEDHRKNPLSRLTFKSISQHPSKTLKKSKNFESLPFADPRSKQISNKLPNKMKRKENPLKTNLISISLDEEKGKKTSHQTQYRFRWGGRENWSEEPNRVRLLKKQQQMKEKSIEAQQEETYNKTIQMFSSCLTERFTKDLVQDTLLIYPAMPKRAPKIFHRRNQIQSQSTPKQRILPHLMDSSVTMENQNEEDDSNLMKQSSRNWRIKGEQIKTKIRKLMLKEKDGKIRRQKIEIDSLEP